MLEKTLESPLDCKEIKLVNPEGNQSWMFIGRTDLEAEAPILWPPNAKSQLIRKDPDAGKDWGQEEKGTTEDEMVGWHHWLNGHEFEQAPGDGEGQGSLACSSPWATKSQTRLSDWTTTKQVGFYNAFAKHLGKPARQDHFNPSSEFEILHRHIHTHTYYSAMKRKEIFPFASTWVKLENKSVT